MAIEKLKLCVCWLTCFESPSDISFACFKQEEQTKLMYFPCSNGNSWIADNLAFTSVPAQRERQRCWIRGKGDGQTVGLQHD